MRRPLLAVLAIVAKSFRCALASPFALAAVLACNGCVLQPPQPVQQHAQYPVIAATKYRAYAGTVDNNLTQEPLTSRSKTPTPAFTAGAKLIW